MDRTACTDLPAFPLQLLLRKHPEWRDHPAAVVEADTPQGTILWINEKARAAGIETGMRYAAGLSLAEDLRAGTVLKQEIDGEVAQLAELMRRFTPSVEPFRDEPGVFWLDAKGLERLFGSLSEWAAGLRAEIRRAGFDATLVIGFDRFAVYALAKGVRHLFASREARQKKVPDTFTSPEEERTAARRVHLDRLALPPPARDALHRLGIVTLGQFVDLPLDGVGVRFGPEVHRLHRLASGSLVEPLKPEHPDVPAMRRIILDHPTFDAPTIVALAEDALGPMLDEIARKGRALAGLQLGFRFERLGDHLESIEPAAPTTSLPTMVELIRLRLQAVRRLPDGVMEIALVARETTATEKQRELFAVAKKRDLDAGARALARLRAAFGDDAVVRAELTDAHLPEARFAWVPLYRAYARPPPYYRRAAPRAPHPHDPAPAPAPRAPRARRLDAPRPRAGADRESRGAVPDLGVLVEDPRPARLPLRGDEDRRAALGVLRSGEEPVVSAGRSGMSPCSTPLFSASRRSPSSKAPLSPKS